ncbi:MAG: hypothetical protein AAF206_05795 [Bacteroidota bacterium]
MNKLSIWAVLAFFFLMVGCDVPEPMIPVEPLPPIAGEDFSHIPQASYPTADVEADGNQIKFIRLDPGHAAPGARIQLIGQNFTANPGDYILYFYPVEQAEIECINEGLIEVVVPESAQSGEVIVVYQDVAYPLPDFVVD